MLRTILILCGLIGPLFMIKKREAIGDAIGNPEWANKFGGIYTVVVIVALIIFFWSLAELTGTTTYLFAPLRWMFLRGGGTTEMYP